MGAGCSCEELCEEYNKQYQKKQDFLDSLILFKLIDIQEYFHNQTTLPHLILHIKPYTNYHINNVIGLNIRRGEIGFYTHRLKQSDHYLIEHLKLSIAKFENAQIGLTKGQCLTLGLIKIEKHNNYQIKLLLSK